MDQLNPPQRPNLISFDSSATVVSTSQLLDSNFDLESQSNPQEPKSNKLDDFTTHDNESILTFIGEDETTDKKHSENTMYLDNVEDFPDGGLKAYLVVFGSFMGLIPCFGIFNILGVIESYVNEHQLSSVDSSIVGWIFSIFSFITYTTCIFSGTYFDRNGAKFPIVIGSILVCSGLVATASSTQVWHFICSFSLLTALGNGLLMSPLVSVVSHYFLKKRAMFSSIATLGGSFGGVIFPILLRELFPKIGYEWSMRVFALICGFCLIFPIILCKERINNSKSHEMESWKHKTITYLSSFDYKSFKEPKFLFNSLGALFAEISTVSLLTFFASYVLQKGFTTNDTYSLVTVINAGTIPGRFISGYLADKLGRYNVIIFTIAMTGVVNLTIWMPFGSSLSVLYAYAIIYGIFSGSIFSLVPVCIGQISKTEEFGKKYSTMYFIIAFGTLFGVPIGGAIIGDKSIDNYNWFIVYASISAFLGSICYGISRFYCVGWKVLTKF
ncbi:Monocarboxylate transporter [Wickerhamomyces ciferrii]|uniref:Monocarboxylate transporter n=1 Tax=Wickerhamomyces ciferrii (strain ATCC 14091 / BCRC 22168 / CBS 111 / JCM 3599 / NBRC 0793 / NRRL Y-1031 F-60-10) TaxID=1206466 RepID=K0K7B8_WICCF|nr:Monocarboxylate transporter [Wickerhamomyces ciferrii]CCH40725.1 Monocarboxylate transporter [Wickerhamomyces ciferrii]